MKTTRETDLIGRLARLIPSLGPAGDRLHARMGIGDDAAIFCPSPRSSWAISCDNSLEGVHFRADLHSQESIGYKSLARAVSDLAAMGARPSYFLLALALPPSKTGRWLDRFARGMGRAAREFAIRLVGGDISKSARVCISISVLGELPRRGALLRSDARPGDLLCVSGKLGGAQLGLELMLHGFAHRRDFKRYLRPHLYPKIALRLAQALAAQRIATAMMDISDGLSTDLHRLCAASRVGARLWADKIPQVQIPVALARKNLDPLALALHGGDDYGLLFTVPPKSLLRFHRLARHPQVTCIGEITRQECKIVVVAPDGSVSPLRSKGWDPFR